VVTDDVLVVDLTDGRTVSVPLAWFPRLMPAEVTATESPGSSPGGATR
jgi:hypothetical protein